MKLQLKFELTFKLKFTLKWQSCPRLLCFLVVALAPFGGGGCRIRPLCWVDVSWRLGRGRGGRGGEVRREEEGGGGGGESGEKKNKKREE